MITGVYTIKFKSEISLSSNIPYFKELYLIDTSRNIDRSFKGLLNKVNKCSDINSRLRKHRADINSAEFELLEELDKSYMYNSDNWKVERKLLLEKLKQKHIKRLEEYGNIVIDISDLKN